MKKVFLFVLVLCPLLANAQGFQVNLQGQKQIGMGGAGAGLKLDAASIYFNPGAVSLLDKNEISAGISPLFLKSTFVESGNNIQYTTSSQIATPFQGYAVWGPEGSKFKFGIGSYVPYGGLVDWGNNWPGRNALQSLDLKVIYIQPTVSYKISDKVGIGAGLVYGTGVVTLKESLPYFDANGQAGNAQLKGSGHGIGYNVGVHFQPTEKFSIGLTYHSKVDAKVTGGDATFSVPASIKGNFPNTKFSSTIPLASITSLGFGFKASEKLTLALDFNYTNWTPYDSLSFIYDKVAGSRVTDSHLPRKYEGSYNVRVGGQYMVSENFAARLGFNYGKTPVKDGYVTPDVPDADRVEFTAGLGYKISDHFAVDASFLFADILKRKQQNLYSGLSGTYKTFVFVPGLSVSYKF